MKFWIFVSIFIVVLTPPLCAQLETQEEKEKRSAYWKTLDSDDLAEKERALSALIEVLRTIPERRTGGSLCHELLSRASLLFSLGDYAKAERDLLEALQFAKSVKVYGDVAHDTGRDENLKKSYRSLASFYLAIGDLKRANQAFDAALFFRDRKAKAERALIEQRLKESAGRDAEYLETGQVKATIGGILHVESFAGKFLRKLGRYDEAYRNFEENLSKLEAAWTIYSNNRLAVSAEADEKSKKKSEIDYFTSKAVFSIELAEIAFLQGNEETALRLCRQSEGLAGEAMQKVRSRQEEMKRTPDALPTGMGIAPRDQLKKFMSAEQLKEMDEIVELAKTGEKSTFESMVGDLAALQFERCPMLYFSLGYFTEAQELIEKRIVAADGSDEVYQSLTYGNNGIAPERSNVLLGDILCAAGEFEKAEVNYEEALGIAEKHYPENHPSTLDIRERLVLLPHFSQSGEVDLTELDKLSDMRNVSLKSILEYGDEMVKIAFASTVDSTSILALVGDEERLADHLIRTKGIVLDSILKDRVMLRSAEAGGAGSEVDRFRELQRKLLDLTLRSDDESKAQLGALKRELLSIRDSLRAGTPLDSEAAHEEVSAQAVLDRLSGDRALVEYFEYSQIRSFGLKERRFGAVLFQNGEISYMDLCAAPDLENRVNEYTKLVRESDDDEEIKTSVDQISDLVVRPLLSSISDETARLIISPDGCLNFVSFAALTCGDGGFLIEKWPVAYVATGRDLLSDTKVSEKSEAVILADPEFDSELIAGLSSVASEGLSIVSQRGLVGGLSFPGLPGTKLEEDLLSSMFEDEWGWKVSSFTGDDAKESAIGAVHSPKILHLATHGFFLPKPSSVEKLPSVNLLPTGGGVAEPEEAYKGVNLENPMLRSGIALAGANTTLRNWEQGVVPETSKDGIMTAEELAMLDLTGTWLVTLSACDTGIGKSVSGEGVIGMRRGLVQAGAKNSLLTLWPVADRETVLIMKSFYSKLAESEQEPAPALAEIQKEYLMKFREENGFALAVKLAGPFILSYRN